MNRVEHLRTCRSSLWLRVGALVSGLLLASCGARTGLADWTGADGAATDSGTGTDGAAEATWTDVPTMDHPTEADSPTTPQTWLASLDAKSNDYAHALLDRGKGRFIAAGGTMSYGGYDGWVGQVEANGSLSWQETISQTGYSVHVNSLGSFAGGDVAGLLEYQPLSSLDANAVVLRLTTEGALVWQRRFAVSGAALVSSGDGVVVAGELAGDLWLVEISAEGTVVWQTIVGTTSANESVRGLVRLADGGYACVGRYGSYGSGDVWVVRFDAEGNLQWDKRIGGPQDDYGNALLETPQGELIVVGATESFTTGGYDSWILRLDSSGQLMSATAVGGESLDWAASVAMLGNGTTVVMGRTHSFGPNPDWFLVGMDTTGTLQWARTIGTDDDDVLSQGLVESQGGLAVVGYSPEAAAQEMLFARLDATGKIQGTCSLQRTVSPTVKTTSTEAVDSHAVQTAGSVNVLDVALTVQKREQPTTILCPQ